MSDPIDTKTKMGMKEKSGAAMMIAAVWIAAGTILKGIGILSLSLSDICVSGFAIAGCFAPAYVSIWIKTWKETQIGKGI